MCNARKKSFCSYPKFVLALHMAASDQRKGKNIKTAYMLRVLLAVALQQHVLLVFGYFLIPVPFFIIIRY